MTHKTRASLALLALFCVILPLNAFGVRASSQASLADATMEELPVTDAEASSTFPPQDPNGYWPTNAVDGDFRTLWVSASGDTVGAWLTVTLANQSLVESMEIYKLGGPDNGGRIQSGHLVFSDGTSQPFTLGIDVEAWYIIHLDPVNTASVQIVVDSVFPGTAFDDVIIPEVRFNGTSTLSTAKPPTPTSTSTASILPPTPTATQTPQAVSSPVFLYPRDGQTLSYDGDFLFEVEPIEGADGYLWGFFQNGEMVWENLRDEGATSGNDYGILSGSESHSRFEPGEVDVLVRASVAGQWTEAAAIAIYLRGAETPTLAPPDIRLTGFTLSDTLSDFAVLQPPIVLRPNTLWIQITNVGQSPFDPPSGAGQYTLQVVLKGTEGKLEEYDFVSDQTLTLEPLRHLESGESQTSYVSNLFFFTPVDNAELEVFFAPGASLGMQNSILATAVSVQDNPDSFQRCFGTVAQVMIKVAKIACPQCRAALTFPDLAIGTLKCGADAVCVAKEDAKWLIGLALGPIGDAGELLSLAVDALFEMGEEALQRAKEVVHGSQVSRPENG